MRQTLIGLLLLAVGFMPVAAQSAEAETVEVVATGVGKDSDAAVKNALRAAVEQAVGALVDTETLAKNDELVSDQILTYSAGYVQSHQILGEPKTADGLVTVKIRAVVKKNELKKKLKSQQIAHITHITQETDVNGKPIIRGTFTETDQLQDAESLAVAAVSRAFAGYPLNVMKAGVMGKPTYDEENEKWTVPVAVRVDLVKYNEFAKRAMAELGKVASSQKQFSQKCHPYSTNKWYFADDKFPEKSISIITQFNEEQRRTQGTTYLFDFQADGSGWRAVWNSVSFTQQNVSVEIVNNENEVIAEKQFKPYVPMGEYGGHVLCPMLYQGSTVFYGSLSMTNVEFKISPDELKRVKSIVVKLNEVN